MGFEQKPNTSFFREIYDIFREPSPHTRPFIRFNKLGSLGQDFSTRAEIIRKTDQLEKRAKRTESIGARIPRSVYRDHLASKDPYIRSLNSSIVHGLSFLVPEAVIRILDIKEGVDYVNF